MFLFLIPCISVQVWRVDRRERIAAASIPAGSELLPLSPPILHDRGQPARCMLLLPSGDLLTIALLSAAEAAVASAALRLTAQQQELTTQLDALLTNPPSARDREAVLLAAQRCGACVRSMTAAVVREHVLRGGVPAGVPAVMLSAGMRFTVPCLLSDILCWSPLPV